MTINYYDQAIKPFFGVVEEVLDDSFVRVRCFGVHPLDRTDVPTEDLPPALVLYPTTGGQVSGGDISHNIEVDAWVMGYFVDFPLCMQPIVTSVIRGSSYSMSTYSSGSGEFVGQGGGSGDYSGNPQVDTGATMNIPGGSTIEKSYNYIYHKLTAEGSSNDPHMHTSAVIGVLMLETSGINPTVVGGYKGRAWGICQWLGERRVQLFRRYGQTKRLDHQLDFMWWELNNTERRAKSRWLQTSNLPDAVAGFCSFERAEEWQNGRVNRSHSNFGKRLKYAYQAYNSMKFSGGPKSTQTVASPQNRGDV